MRCVKTMLPIRIGPFSFGTTAQTATNLDSASSGELDVNLAFGFTARDQGDGRSVAIRADSPNCLAAQGHVTKSNTMREGCNRLRGDGSALWLTFRGCV